MTQTTVCPTLLAQEYNEFITLLNLELPTTHDGWLERSAKENAKRSAQGFVLQYIVVHPQEFSRYCRDCVQDPSLTMLNAFAVAKSTGNLKAAT